MNGETLEHKVLLTNPQGLHLRPLTAFARMAQRFASQVTVAFNGKRVDGKSPIELMLLAAPQGSELTVAASGPDARAALEALVNVLNTPFADEEPAPPAPPDDGSDFQI